MYVSWIEFGILGDIDMKPVQIVVSVRCFFFLYLPGLEPLTFTLETDHLTNCTNLPTWKITSKACMYVYQVGK